jgi:hypothetical protein
MIDINHAIDVAKLLIATAEGLASAIDKAKQSLDASTALLKQALTEAEKMRDQLAKDRKEADDALDRKFDHPKDPGDAS